MSVTFFDLSSTGALEKTEYIVECGDETECLLVLPKQIGEKFQKISQRVDGVRLGVKLADVRFPLRYHHATKHFAHASNPTFPRLELSRPMTGLGNQSESGESAATIWTGGLMDVITLDGTPDAQFWEIAAQSMKDLAPAMKKLKDM